MHAYRKTLDPGRIDARWASLAGTTCGDSNSVARTQERGSRRLFPFARQASHEGLPHLVAWLPEFGEKVGIAVRPYGAFEKSHTRFLGGPPSFFGITAQAAANDVVPARRAASAARHHVVDTELAGGETLAAILAPVIVSCEEIAAVEAHGRLRHTIVAHQSDDARHLQRECHCPNELVLLAPFQLPPQYAQFAPRPKVVVGELAVLDVDHLGDVPVKQAECSPDVDHVDGQIGAVKHKDAGLEGLTTLATAQLGGCQTIGSRSSRLAEGDYLRTDQEGSGDLTESG